MHIHQHFRNLKCVCVSKLAKRLIFICCHLTELAQHDAATPVLHCWASVLQVMTLNLVCHYF